MPVDPSKPTIEDIDSAPDDAGMSATDLAVSDSDYREQLARVGDERDELQAENEALKRKDRTHQILDSLIIPYAERTFIFMCVYCAVVAALLALDGAGFWGFDLPEGVLQLLVGSTATTVIGLVGMVLTGIFVGARRNHD